MPRNSPRLCPCKEILDLVAEDLYVPRGRRAERSCQWGYRPAHNEVGREVQLALYNRDELVVTTAAAQFVQEVSDVAHTVGLVLHLQETKGAYKVR